MADTNIRGYHTIAGAHGTLWIDNEKIAEFSKVNAKVTPDRKDVQLGLSVDSKIVALKGEGSITLEKVYSRGKKIAEKLIKGHDPRVRIVTNLADPDTPGKQEERISLDNVWFNSIDLINIARGEIVEEEYPFGFTPEDLAYENDIK
jgi:hypothetical protein|nr:MAG TPA: tail tube protein [Caudoviricetes sp.]